MGVDAELYAAAAASRDDQFACVEPQRDVIKQTPEHNGGFTVAGENLTQNGGVNLDTRQEGAFVVCAFVCCELKWFLSFLISLYVIECDYVSMCH